MVDSGAVHDEGHECMNVHEPPRDRRMSRSNFLWDIAGRFSNDNEVADNSIDGLRIRMEGFEVHGVHLLQDPVDGFQDVFDSMVPQSR